MSQLLEFVLIFIIVIGGFCMIVGGHPLMTKFFRKVFKALVAKPIHWVLNKGKILAGKTLRYISRKLAHALKILFRCVGRKCLSLMHTAWVRLTT